jgi:hypothetical protein
MKYIIITLIIALLLCGCQAQEQQAQNQEQSLFAKYTYDCAKDVDHETFDYNMQQNKIQQCFNKCCEGEYCDQCNFMPNDYECYQECENNKPQNTCVNCDGYCWDKAFSAYLDQVMRTC